MSLLSRLGRVLKAEVGRRLPNVDPEVPWYETPKGARYGGAQTGGAQTGGAQTGAANESDTNESHVNEHHVDARIAGYYAALELPIGADITAVKQAHRRLMKRYHPDRFHANLIRLRLPTNSPAGSTKPMTGCGNISRQARNQMSC